MPSRRARKKPAATAHRVHRKNETPGGVCQKNRSINQATMIAARPYRQGECDILEPHEKGDDHGSQDDQRNEDKRHPLPALGAHLGLLGYSFLIFGFRQFPVCTAVGHGSDYSDNTNSNPFSDFDKYVVTITSYLKLSKVVWLSTRRFWTATYHHDSGDPYRVLREGIKIIFFAVWVCPKSKFGTDPNRNILAEGTKI
jgi:hypothetical protein